MSAAPSSLADLITAFFTVTWPPNSTPALTRSPATAIRFGSCWSMSPTPADTRSRV